MKSMGNAMTPDGPVARRVDFVVSDVEGRSAAGEVTDCVVGALQDLGYRVGVNDPYKGGEIVKRVGDPAAGVHSVQVEVNRALYLDESRVEKTMGFAPLCLDLEGLTRHLVEAATALG
jgi:N-formylglutamate deformylase